MPAFSVYIIYSTQLDRYYVGYTSDLRKRSDEHNTGVSSYTSKANDWVLKHSEEFPSRELAMKKEKEIKAKKSRKYIEYIIYPNN
ncbi:MAG: GIY-YIG nuclease family protein [Bacteroidetes bacterium]|nr:GIY-YIG nuclease family protein [Bacteroidota bacterium]